MQYQNNPPPPPYSKFPNHPNLSPTNIQSNSETHNLNNFSTFHSNMFVNPNLNSNISEQNGIPLLPVQNIDHNQSQLKIYQRALEDFERSSSPFNWGKYRHGKLLKSNDELENYKITEWIIWIVELFGPQEDLSRRSVNSSSIYNVHGGVY
ncbi:uncharacterized protein I206_100947 [Kwoniella pini CBS 10737]|uniref:Uncharacterized protein n=1 Tax=Kwoniella pini CBS 10737 TaxID=1296096 RepID=A0A1B9IBR4_9TREE|nr:uncharacterized protein I206_00379 [Kwoniella pini CBS 10737]OCF53078.1 hypothetical protein I206_00379 [Kwoniella pini CBS 10737]